MAYYAGDFYRGDFYRGDPGFFSFIGGLARSAVGVIPGVGPVASAALAKFGAKPGVGMIRAAATGAIERAGGIVRKHPILTAAGAAGTIGMLGMGAGRAMRPEGLMRGYHISKKTGKMVRNRRMRVTNPRALRRAIRRANGFARLARRVLHFTSPRAPRGRAVFRHRRRKKI